MKTYLISKEDTHNLVERERLQTLAKTETDKSFETVQLIAHNPRSGRVETFYYSEGELSAYELRVSSLTTEDLENIHSWENGQRT